MSVCGPEAPDADKAIFVNVESERFGKLEPDSFSAKSFRKLNEDGEGDKSFSIKLLSKAMNVQ